MTNLLWRSIVGIRLVPGAKYGPWAVGPGLCWNHWYCKLINWPSEKKYLQSSSAIKTAQQVKDVQGQLRVFADQNSI